MQCNEKLSYKLQRKTANRTSISPGTIAYPIGKATIDLEPKIRTEEQKLILVPKNKTTQTVSVPRLSSDHNICHFAYLSPGNICFSNVLISTSLLQSSRKTFFASLFLESIKCKTFPTKSAFLRILARVDSLQ